MTFGSFIYYWNRWWGWRRWTCTGVWAYHFNTYTGERLAVRVSSQGHQPVDRAWLQAGTSYTIIGGNS